MSLSKIEFTNFSLQRTLTGDNFERVAICGFLSVPFEHTFDYRMYFCSLPICLTFKEDRSKYPASWIPLFVNGYIFLCNGNLVFQDN